MSSHSARFVACAGLIAASIALSGPCLATTIDFEGLSDSSSVGTHFSGLNFTNAIVLTVGVSLNELEFPPHSGVNVVSDSTGPITIAFSTPEIKVSGYFTYTERLSLQAFDASNTLVDSISSLFTNNNVSTGNAPNELLSLSAAGISKVVITGDIAGGSFVLDDLSFTAAVTTPLPATLPLFATGLAGLGFVAHRRKRKQAA